MTYKERLEKEVGDFLALRQALGYNHIKYQPITSFVRFCDNNYPNFENITKEMFDAWIAHKNFKTNHYVLPIIFRMMYCCGIRPQEPLSLLCDDVNLDTGEIFIRQAKRQKDRRILMSSDLTKFCRKYDSFFGHRKFFFEYDDEKQ